MRVGLVLVFVAACAVAFACNRGAVTSAFPNDGVGGSPTPDQPNQATRDGELPLRPNDGGICDPMATAPGTAVTLTHILGAGRAKDGTVYVLDSPGGVQVGEPRAFVSMGAELLQHDVIGSGVVGETLVEASLDGLEIEVESSTAGGPPTRMGVVKGPLAPGAKTFDIGTQGEELTLLSASDLAGYTVEAASDPIDVDFDAVTADGHELIVFSPLHLTSYDQYRVFYGTLDAMVEQHATVNNSSATWIEFTLDGTPYSAYLPTEASAPELGGPMLNEGSPANQRVPLTYLFPALDFNPAILQSDGGFVTYRDAGTGTLGSRHAPTFFCLQ